MSFNEKTNWLKVLYYYALHNKYTIENLVVIKIDYDECDYGTDISFKIAWDTNRTEYVKVYSVQEWINEQ